jgi:hypothetical protein
MKKYLLNIFKSSQQFLIDNKAKIKREQDNLIKRKIKEI